MARIIIKKVRKEFIPELNREVIVGKGARFYISDTSRAFSSLHGTIQPCELAKADGSEIVSDNGKKFTIFSPSFVDEYKRLKRLPQAIPPKDIGVVIAETGVGPTSFCVDSGTGSGAMACFLAHVCGRVVTYDIEDEHLAVARENKERLRLGNLEIKKGDFTLGVEEKGADLVTLDLPAPWDAIGTSTACLKIGGFLVSYSPSMAQAMDMANALLGRDDFIIIKNVEVMEREWEIEARKVRPKNKSMIHSGFLTIARKIK